MTSPNTLEVETLELNPATAASTQQGSLRFPRLPNEAIGVEAARLQYLGVDLSKYPSIEERTVYEPIVARKSRDIVRPLVSAHLSKWVGLTPSPLMLSHIVTTRCNYSCHFCCFADTLNAKTNELTLPEIKKTYQSIGRNLNVIVYSGGETTLNRNLADIIELAYTHTPVQSVYIISNAWKPELLFQITHQVMQRCPDLHLTWSLSIEGPKEVNNATRHTKAENWDAWQNTIDVAFGLKRMRALFGYKQLDVQMCTVCAPSNVDVLDDWYETIRDVIQPDKWNLNLMRRSVQMDSVENFDALSDRHAAKRVLEPFEEKYLEMTERVRQDVLSGQLKFLYHTTSPGDGALKSAVDLVSQEQNRRTVREESDKVCCRAGWNGAFIGSEGQVSGCEEFAMNPFNSKAYGNLRDVDFNFQALWHSEKAREYRKQVGEAKECQGCTLESQRNYPSILVSLKNLKDTYALSKQIK